MSIREAWKRDTHVLTYMRATRPRRIALCAALFWVIWGWHFLFAVLLLPTMIAFVRDRNWPVLFIWNALLGWIPPTWAILLCYVAWTQNPAPLIPRHSVMVTTRARLL